MPERTKQWIIINIVEQGAAGLGCTLQKRVHEKLISAGDEVTPHQGNKTPGLDHTGTFGGSTGQSGLCA